MLVLLLNGYQIVLILMEKLLQLVTLQIFHSSYLSCCKKDNVLPTKFGFVQDCWCRIGEEIAWATTNEESTITYSRASIHTEDSLIGIGIPIINLRGLADLYHTIILVNRGQGYSLLPDT